MSNKLEEVIRDKQKENYLFNLIVALKREKSAVNNKNNYPYNVFYSIFDSDTQIPIDVEETILYLLSKSSKINAEIYLCRKVGNQSYKEIALKYSETVEFVRNRVSGVSQYLKKPKNIWILKVVITSYSKYLKERIIELNSISLDTKLIDITEKFKNNTCFALNYNGYLDYNIRDFSQVTIEELKGKRKIGDSVIEDVKEVLSDYGVILKESK